MIIFSLRLGSWQSGRLFVLVFAKEMRGRWAVEAACMGVGFRRYMNGGSACT